MTIIERIAFVLRAESVAIASVPITPEAADAVVMLANCVGKIVTMGMGKAGLMAQKMAATLCSTGTSAVFLHPGEAMHGDLGVLCRDDVLVVFSTSGKTDEVLEALDAARVLGVRTVIGITSHPDGPIRERCDVVLEMGVIEEPCPVGLTPSASCAAMLAIGDALSLAVMEVKGMGSDYAMRKGFGDRHRAGYLGAVAIRGAA
jgi:arabinose-5-phosphate isomerase